MMDVSGVPDIASTGLILAEAEPWVQPLSLVLDPFLNLFSFAMLCRVVLSWYPTTNVNELPWNIVTWPTEPLLRAIRGSVPPAFGVDITPIVWLGIFTFFHEILLGQQGLLTMKLKYGI
jgi:YggT family protein